MAFAITKPTVGGSTDTWGTENNAALTALESEQNTATTDKNIADYLLDRPHLGDYSEQLRAGGNVSGAVTVNFEDGNHHEFTFTGNVTFTFSNPPATGRVGILVLYIKQGGAGSYTATWPASVKWAGGSAPTLTTTVGRTDILTFITRDAGTSYAGQLSMRDVTI